MNKVKFTYEQPSCENLVVRFEENIMSAKWSNKANDPGIIEDEDITRTYGF